MDIPVYIDLTPVERPKGICFQSGHVQIRSVNESSQNFQCTYRRKEGVKKLCRAMIASCSTYEPQETGSTILFSWHHLSVSDMHHRIAQHFCGPGQIDDLDIRRCNSICNLFSIILEISDLFRCVQNDLPTILHSPSQSWIITCTKLRKLPFISFIMIPPHANTTYHGHRIPGWYWKKYLKKYLYVSQVSWMHNLASIDSFSSSFGPLVHQFGRLVLPP